MSKQLKLDFTTLQQISNQVTEKCIICKQKDQEPESFYCDTCWPIFQLRMEEKIKIKQSLKKPY